MSNREPVVDLVSDADAALCGSQPCPVAAIFRLFHESPGLGQLHLEVFGVFVGLTGHWLYFIMVGFVVAVADFEALVVSRFR
ncbi:hypothetical protein BDN72DRAFT_906378 [Pluteus cervinus]|uniref:Uncharacterized protein n=1 Tax=Pluteus cervinus TaxID=181527 RepID=A0ACD3A0I5_9AGAR|nr:hypothetical protein BDN72DRAFT_906378 [Pluteus cervinus]